MRKSSWIMVGMLVAALCAMLFAANAMISPLQRDAELSGLLTRYFAGRGDLRPGTKLTALRARGSEKRLAKEGRGIVAELFPADPVLAEEGGLGNLARAVARRVYEETGTAPDWVELKFRLGPTDGPPDLRPLRTLVVIDQEGAVGSPTPPLPSSLDGAPARTSEGTPASPAAR